MNGDGLPPVSHSSGQSHEGDGTRMNNSAPQWLTRTRTQLCGDLTELEQLYSALYSRCSRDQLGWPPAAGAWSIAECMEHVSQSTLQYLVPIRMAIAKGAPPAPTDDDDVFRPG